MHTTLEINLSALAENYRLLQRRAKRAEVAGVVKADAYGLGIREIAPASWRAGCKQFFVATLDEAIELRKLLSKATIYVFFGVSEGEEKTFRHYKLIPVLNDVWQIKLWQKLSKNNPAILHYDTGMNRLGLAPGAEPDLSNLDIRYIMSHLACANEPNRAINKEQLKKLNAIRKRHPHIKVSFANSAGILAADCYHFDLARPGIALYGSTPIDGKKALMKPVVTLKAPILQLRTLTQSETVGYGATKKMPKGSVLATLPIGYADGYLRSLSNKAIGYIGSRPVPLVGRVSMDLIVVDVTDIPARNIPIGTEVELLGKHMTVDRLAQDAGTIAYEIFTRLGNRFKRNYSA